MMEKSVDSSSEMQISNKKSDQLFVHDNKESIHSELAEKASRLTLNGSTKKRTGSSFCVLM